MSFTEDLLYINDVLLNMLLGTRFRMEWDETVGGHCIMTSFVTSIIRIIRLQRMKLAGQLASMVRERMHPEY
jgi:hypothetical protein